MPTKTTLGQLCTGQYDTAGALKFKIVSSVDYVKPGDLPFASIFVNKIVVTDDPKSDVFLRVGNVVDLTTIPLSRDAALIANVVNYLTIDFTVTYNDVTTATAAKALIQARVDSLIADWIKFQAQFIIPDSVELPASDSTIVKAATDTYTKAKKAHDDAETALTKAMDDLTDAQAAATRASAASTTGGASCTACTQNDTLLATGLSATAVLRGVINGGSGTIAGMQTFITQATAFQVAHPDVTFAAQIAAFTTVFNALKAAMLTEAQDGLAVVASAQTAISDACTVTCAAATAAVAAKTAADAAVAKALTTATTAEGTATAAQTALEQALASLLQVCPSFDVNA